MKYEDKKKMKARILAGALAAILLFGTVAGVLVYILV